MSRIQRLTNSSRREASEDPDDVVPSFRQSLSYLATLKDRKVAPKSLRVELLQPFDNVWWHTPLSLCGMKVYTSLVLALATLGASMSEEGAYKFQVL